MKRTRLNELRGAGLGSRMLVPAIDLPDGWRFERRSDRYCVWFDDRGNRYKSVKEVEDALRDRGLMRRDLASETETETDTGSEYEPSPIKIPRSEDQPGPRYLHRDPPRYMYADTCTYNNYYYSRYTAYFTPSRYPIHYSLARLASSIPCWMH